MTEKIVIVRAKIPIGSILVPHMEYYIKNEGYHSAKLKIIELPEYDEINETNIKAIIDKIYEK